MFLTRTIEWWRMCIYLKMVDLMISILCYTLPLLHQVWWKRSMCSKFWIILELPYVKEMPLRSRKEKASIKLLVICYRLFSTTAGTELLISEKQRCAREVRPKPPCQEKPDPPSPPSPFEARQNFLGFLRNFLENFVIFMEFSLNLTEIKLI